MATSREVYKKFLLKVNKNDTNTNIKIGKGEFILIYNEQGLAWLNDKIKKDSSTSDKNNIGALLVEELPLEKFKELENYTEFKLPDNYFNYQSSFSIAKQGECSRRLFNWDFKTRNKSVLQQDENNNPSFEYEETLINISNNKLIVFRKDFTIEEQYMTYYKIPLKIDLEGYVNLDGTNSTNIDPDLDDIYVDEIINRCVLEVTKNYKDIEGFQLSQTRTII